MKTRQKSKIEEKNPETHGLRGVWRLDLKLEKEEILRDLELLSTIYLQPKKSENTSKVFS